MQAAEATEQSDDAIEELESLDDKNVRIRDNEAPDGGWGWVIVAAATLNSVITFGFERSYSLVYLKLTYMFDVPATELALIAGLYSAMRSFSAPIASVLCNRFGHRETAVLGGALSGIFMIMSAFPISVPYLLVTRGVLSGFSQSLLVTPISVMPGLYFNKKKARANSIVAAGRSIGGIVFPFVLTLLLDEYGYQGTMLIVAGLSFHHCAFSGLYRPRKVASEQKSTINTTETLQKPTDVCNVQNETCLQRNDVHQVKVGNDGSPFAKHKYIEKTSSESSMQTKTTKCQHICFRLKQLYDISNLRLLFNEILIVICLAFAAYTACMYNTLIFIANMATEDLSINVYQVSLVLTVSGVVDTVFRVLGGCLFDLKCLRSWRSLLHAFVGIVTGLFVILLTLLANDFLSLTLLWILTCLLWGTFVAQLPTIVFDLVGPKDGTSAFGFVALAGGIGFLAGSAGGGKLKDVYGSYKAAFYMGGTVFASASILYAVVYILRRKKYQKNKTTSPWVKQ